MRIVRLTCCVYDMSDIDANDFQLVAVKAQMIIHSYGNNAKVNMKYAHPHQEVAYKKYTSTQAQLFTCMREIHRMCRDMTSLMTLTHWYFVTTPELRLSTDYKVYIDNK